jgi:hypothetical protein
MNKMLLSLLKTSSTHAFSLTGSVGIPKLLKRGILQNSARPSFIMTSADLSAASDYIRHDLAKAVWDGVVAAFGDRLPPLYAQFGYLLLKEQMYEAADGTWRQTKQGILMGLSLTWPILSLVQDFCAHQAVRGAEKESGYKIGNCYHICGDDLVAAWTTNAQSRYYTMIKEVGLVLNEHKTYESKSGAVFTEQLYLIRSWSRREDETPLPDTWTGPGIHTGPPTLWDWVNRELSLKNLPKSTMTKYVKVHHVVRPLLSATITAKRRGSLMHEKVPLYLSLGSILTAEHSACGEPWRQEALLSIARRVHASTWRIWEQSKLPIHWPSSLGGWGVPGKPEAPVPFRRAAAVILNGQPELGKKLMQLFLSAVSPLHLRGKLRLLTECISNTPERLPEFDLPARPSKLKDALGEMVSRLLAYHSFDPAYDKRKSKSKTYKANAIGRKVRKLVQQALSKWRSVKPMDPNKVGKALARVESLMVDTKYLTSLLHYTGTPDRIDSRIPYEARTPLGPVVLQRHLTMKSEAPQGTPAAVDAASAPSSTSSEDGEEDPLPTTRYVLIEPSKLGQVQKQNPKGKMDT